MNMAEFNYARLMIDPDLALAKRNPSPENLSRLALKMALQGLVAVPIDHYPDTIPQPICAMEFVPTGELPESQRANSYLVPADQIR